MRFALARPLSARRKTREASLGEVLVRVQDFCEKESPVAPETAALEFYLLNHAVGLVRQQKGLDEPLGELGPVVTTYYSGGTDLAVRMFVYLLLICNGEARHATHHPPDFWPMMRQAFSIKVATYHEGLQELDKASREPARNHLLEHPPPVSVGLFIESLRWVFKRAKWSGSFGGKKWAAVADLLRRYVGGEVSPEQMIDTAFTLAHNTGPVFDKGMGLFDHYKSMLLEILDVQAAGQIPQMIWSEDNKYISAVRWMHSLCVERLGKEQLIGPVDWEAVIKATGDPDRIQGYKTKAVQALETASKTKQAVAEESLFNVPMVPAPGVKKVPRPKKKFIVAGSKKQLTGPMFWDGTKIVEVPSVGLWDDAEKG